MRELYEAVFGGAYPGYIAADGHVVAFCAGPVPPSDKPAARAADKTGMVAFCAGPVPPSDKPAAHGADKAGAIAFCAGPIPPRKKLNPLVKEIAGAIVSRSGPAAIPRPVPVLPA